MVIVVSEDEDEAMLSIGKSLPTVPPNQGPPTVQLSVLIDYAVQKTYHELTVLSELLPKKMDVDRKISIVQFAHATRLLFIRLLAVVKWVKNASKVEACTAISYFLDQQASFFVETADKLVFLAREELLHARLPAFQIPAAVDVLTLGSYPRLPLCIKNRFVPEEPISDWEQACALQRLNQVIQYRLACAARYLPAAIKDVHVGNGMVTIRVPGEFEAALTLLGELAETSWTLLNVKILVEDFEIGDGTDLVHPLQLHYLHQLLQARLNTSEQPLKELYTVVHSFCQSLQLDVLYCQSSTLIAERLGEHLSIENYIEGQQLTLSYWQSGRSQTRSLRQYRLTIEVDSNSDLHSLKVRHWPPSNHQETLPILEPNSPKFSIEHLLTETALVRCRIKLRALRQKLEKMASVNCRLTGNAIPALTLPLLSSADPEESLSVAVNVYSGLFMCQVPKLGSSETLRELERAINEQRSPSAHDALSKIRCELLAARCRSTLSSLPLRIADNQMAANKLNLGQKQSLCLQFIRDETCYLVVSFDPSGDRDVQLGYHLVSTEQTKSSILFPTHSAPSAGSLTKTHEMVRLQAGRLTNCGRKRQNSQDSCPLEVKRPHVQSLYVSELRVVATALDRRLAIMNFTAELRKRSVRFRLQDDVATSGQYIRILGFEKLSASDAGYVARFWPRMLSCAVRLRQSEHQKRSSWSFECLLSDPPLSADEDSDTKTRSVVQNFDNKNVDTIVENIVLVVCAFARLHAPVKRFAIEFRKGMNAYIKVKAYHYLRLVLAYGPDFAFTLVVNWGQNECYHLSFGVHERVVPTSATNPHIVMAPMLQEFFNKTHDLALLMQVLHESARPLRCIQQIARATISPAKPTPVLSAALIPTRASAVRMLFQGSVALEFMFLSGGRMAVRDCATQANLPGSTSRLLPVVGLKEFLRLFSPETEQEPPSASRGNRQTVDTASPAASVDHQPSSVQSTTAMGASAFSPAPPSNAPLMTPSPAPGFGALMEPSPIAGRQSAVPTTPLAPPTSEFGPSPAPASDMKMDFSMSQPGSTQNLKASNVPVVITSAGFENACMTETRNQSAFERFLCSQLNFSKLRALVQSNAIKDVSDAVDSGGCIEFNLRGLQEQSSCGFTAFLDPTRQFSLSLKLRIVPTGTDLKLQPGDDQILEEYFVNRVCRCQSANAFQSFFSIIRQTAPGVLKAFVAIMKQELQPDSPWTAELCPLQPRSLPNSPAGGAGVRLNDSGTQMLFWLKLRSSEKSGGPPALPLTYLAKRTPDGRTVHEIKLLLNNPSGDQFLNEVAKILAHQTETCANQLGGECPIYPAIRHLKSKMLEIMN